MPQRVRSVAVGYYIGITLLVIGLVIAFALVTRIAGPSRGLQVGEPVALACETGDGSPSCFDFTVRNTSSEQLSALCVVVPAQGTIARFTSDQSTVSLTLGPSDEQTLRTSVDAVVGDEVAAPNVDCDLVSG